MLFEVVWFFRVDSDANGSFCAGLRELVDYLPGAIVTIVSYCLAEVTRGLWKFASMNGQDWPSPAANLLAIQGEVKDILGASGVHISNPPGNNNANSSGSCQFNLSD